MAKQNELPSFTSSDYVKFFGAGALAATLTHGVCCELNKPREPTRRPKSVAD